MSSVDATNSNMNKGQTKKAERESAEAQPAAEEENSSSTSSTTETTETSGTGTAAPASEPSEVDGSAATVNSGASTSQNTDDGSLRRGLTQADERAGDVNAVNFARRAAIAVQAKAALLSVLDGIEVDAFEPLEKAVQSGAAAYASSKSDTTSIARPAFDRAA